MISEQLDKIREEALKQIRESEGLDRLNEIRVNILGKKGELTSILKSMKDVAPEDRPKVGQLVNETREAIEKVLEEKVNPLLKKDGGWIELVDVQGFAVKLRFLGMCSGCGSAAITLKTVVEKALKENIDKEIEVEQA